MLEPIEQAILVAIDNLTRGTLESTDGQAIASELDKMGLESPNRLILGRLVGHLKNEGYLKDSAFVSASGPIFVELNGRGREQARANADPFQEVNTEARRFIASDRFAAAYPEAFEKWADAEKLVIEDSDNLTDIGHKLREATQAFATALVQAHGPADVDPEPAHTKNRLRAVIDHSRGALGKRRPALLDALLALCDADIDLIQRQEHGEQKGGSPLSWNDGRRIVYTTMLLMIEFACIVEEIPPPHTAVMEPAGRSLPVTKRT